MPDPDITTPSRTGQTSSTRRDLREAARGLREHVEGFLDAYGRARVDEAPGRWRTSPTGHEHDRILSPGRTALDLVVEVDAAAIVHHLDVAEIERRIRQHEIERARC